MSVTEAWQPAPSPDIVYQHLSVSSNMCPSLRPKIWQPSLKDKHKTFHQPQTSHSNMVTDPELEKTNGKIGPQICVS